MAHIPGDSTEPIGSVLEAEYDLGQGMVKRTGDDAARTWRCKKRPLFTSEQLAILEKVREETGTPDLGRRRHLAEELNVDQRSVYRWFYRRRRRTPLWQRQRSSESDSSVSSETGEAIALAEEAPKCPSTFFPTVAGASLHSPLTTRFSTCLLPSEEPYAAPDLARFFSPQYVEFAKELPPTSYTLRNHIWSDAQATFEANDPVESAEKLLDYLSKFFSAEVANTIRSLVKSADESFCGRAYALRGTYVSFVRRLLRDLPLEEPVDGGGAADRRQGGRSPMVTPAGNELGPGPPAQVGRPRGRGGRLTSAGRRSPPRNAPDDVHHAFANIDVIDVEMPAFSTPIKKSHGRAATVKERALAFGQHEKLRKFSRLLYDPNDARHRTIRLFHGSRARHWRKFRRQAFEHALLNHISLEENDFIFVIQFDVPVAVLHGEVPPCGRSEPFKVRWFGAADSDWAEFCRKNMSGGSLYDNHEFDIVIGPICIPKALEAGGHSYEALRIRIDGVGLVQVAFCTLASVQWLEACSKKVYFERRQQSLPVLGNASS